MYGNDAVDPRRAVKYAALGGAGCQEWLNEYAKYGAMARRLSASGLLLSGYAGPVDIQDHVLAGSGSYMLMERVARPPAAALAAAGLAPPPGADHLSLQLRLGAPALDLVEPAGGHLVGVAQTERLLAALGVPRPERYLEELVKACGELLAAIHFVGLNDAFGVGVLGHYDAADPAQPLKAIFVNFSQSRDMAAGSERAPALFRPDHPDYATNLEQMAWGAKGYSFFPQRGSRLRPYFSGAYRGLAQSIGALEAAAAGAVLGEAS